MILKPKHSVYKTLVAGDICDYFRWRDRVGPIRVEIVGFDEGSDFREVLVVLINEQQEYPWSNCKPLNYDLYNFENKLEADSLISPYIGRTQTWVGYSELVLYKHGSKEYTLEQLLFRL